VPGRPFCAGADYGTPASGRRCGTPARATFRRLARSLGSHLHKEFFMQRITYPRSGIARALAAAAAVLIIIIMTARMRADVVLHPGTVTGTFGLTNWTFDNASVGISGNANGFSGSASATGGTYSVTVEGGQTYTSVYESLSRNSPYASFSLSRTTSLTVPV